MAVVRAAMVMACVAAFSITATAQWPRYIPPDVPRTAAGEPDLNAPVPRTADGKVDLSGVWRGVGGLGRGRGAGPPPEGPPVAGFAYVGQSMQGGLPFQSWAAELRQQRMADNSKDNPEALCLPMGIMQFHTQGFPRKFVQTPDVLVILYEASMGIRQIFTDGRPLPDNDPQPWWYGYSVGRWEDDELVVETIGIRDGEWLDIQGSPLTGAAKLTERFRRVSYGRMEIDVTVDDPKAYTRPWTVRVNQQLIPEQELIEFVCLENQRFNPQ